MNEAQALGRAVRSEMVANGMGRKDLAEAVGVSTDSLGKYLRGELEPSLEKLRAFAEALNCSVGYLINRQEQIKGWATGSQHQSIDGDGNLAVGGSIENSTVVIGDPTTEAKGRS